MPIATLAPRPSPIAAHTARWTAFETATPENRALAGSACRQCVHALTGKSPAGLRRRNHLPDHVCSETRALEEPLIEIACRSVKIRQMLRCNRSSIAPHPVSAPDREPCRKTYTLPAQWESQARLGIPRNSAHPKREHRGLIGFSSTGICCSRQLGGRVPLTLSPADTEAALWKRFLEISRVRSSWSASR